MMSKWVGYAVSVNCGEPLGCYQGTILEANGTTITLTKAFRNGFPYPKSQVTLNAADIKELKIIEQRGEPAEQTHSTVAVSKGKKGQRATVCENLQANPTSSGNQAAVCPAGGGRPAPRSKPIDIQGARTNKPNVHSGSYGNGSSTPKGRGGAERGRRRHEAFLGDPADTALAGDFDFEGNLALFDKQALWEEMRSGQYGQRPDVVAEAGKLRHDENVLGAAAADAGIVVPAALRAAADYVTDEGGRVPSLAPAARRLLWRSLRAPPSEASGAAQGAPSAPPSAAAAAAHLLLARAAADVALRLVGGDRRLDPRNAHQAPVVVSVCGAHGVGGAGLAAARLLRSHGARAACLLLPAAGGAEPGPGPGAGPEPELRALRAAGVGVYGRADLLPRPDLVLLAVDDPDQRQPLDEHQLDEALSWVRGCRAAVMSLEPGAGAARAAARAAVVGLLPPPPPPAPPTPSAPRLYLANLAPPPALFASLDISYRPPFGAAAVLALHPADD